MNLKEWAAAKGIGYTTARRWYRDGLLPVPARKIGGLVVVDAAVAPARQDAAVVYARVSSAEPCCATRT
ncbi:recombinase family protein [Candidatus Frankia alpina]|uniref:recombinase family protein n=1 Tax=Candidatus Frankia alpina TaxID=2699483 RepID=UPI001967F9C5|nr:recombinase family protein [Candidatus Frankia alpina]